MLHKFHSSEPDQQAHLNALCLSLSQYRTFLDLPLPCNFSVVRSKLLQAASRFKACWSEPSFRCALSYELTAG